MSGEPSNTVDPFDITALDEETELRALERALRFGDKFALIFARCNQPQQRRQLIGKLRNQLPEFNVQEIDFGEPTTHLLDSLRGRISNPRPDAVFVSGLEYSLPTAAAAHSTQFVANLNASRNSFPNVVPCPLVLWVPEYILTAVVRGAPDFFSVRSGIYFFAAAPAETGDFARSLTAGGDWASWNLSLTEKQERIAAIESLLADYEALPSNQRDYQIEMRLHSRLGSLLLTQGAYSSAQQHFEESLRIAVTLSRREWKGDVLNRLGSAFINQGLLKEARAAYLESLVIAQEFDRREDKAQNLNNLGDIYLVENQQEKAEEAYKQSLEISQEGGFRGTEVQALTGLGDLQRHQGRLEEAEKIFQRAFIIAHETQDQSFESYVLRRLGNIFVLQGRLEEANDMYQQSLEISRKLGYVDGEGGTLLDLANLRKVEGRAPEALEIARQSVLICERTEFPGALEWARELVRTLEMQLQERSDLASTKE